MCLFVLSSPGSDDNHLFLAFFYIFETQLYYIFINLVDVIMTFEHGHILSEQLHTKDTWKERKQITEKRKKEEVRSRKKEGKTEISVKRKNYSRQAHTKK